VAARLNESGVRNPVTAVLLNFRGYDTLLEIAVLLVAALAVRALAVVWGSVRSAVAVAPGPVLTGLLRLVAPQLVLISGYLLWVGGHAPGGAFQAGATLAALGVLLLLCDSHLLGLLPDCLERLALSVGLLVFIALGVVGMAAGRLMLQYSPAHAPWLMLAIEAASALSIAAVLVTAFAAGRLSATQNAAPSETKGEPQA
jgi:multisubunit Na+/H+ antiporter MnhB subunit